MDARRRLEDELGRLKGEIYKTETWDYKEQLRAREQTLESLLDGREGGT